MVELLIFAKIPRSTYYYYTKKVDEYATIKEEILSIYHENKGRYGYRRITLEVRNRGYSINHKTVQKLMKELRIKSLVRVKRYKSYKGEVENIAPNIIQRNFKADKLSEKWATDVTEFSLLGTKIYLSPIIDMFNGEIISYNVNERPLLAQVMDMLDKAFLRLPNKINLVLHSDQGWQYQHIKYQKRLEEKGIKRSMSRKGNCLDNSVIENFFGLLKSEFFYLKKFSSIEKFKMELEEYIYYYNNKRIKSKLKGMSPVQHRIHSSIVI